MHNFTLSILKFQLHVSAAQSSHHQAVYIYIYIYQRNKGNHTPVIYIKLQKVEQYLL